MLPFIGRRPAVVWFMFLALSLATGCASLQVDVDVYKGPLAHEPEIQVRQYAAMATAAKPLLLDLFCREVKVNPPPAGKALPQCTNAEAIKKCSDFEKFKAKFLCETLSLYENVSDDNKREYAFNALKGLDSLTKAVTKAMAQSSGTPADRKKIDAAVQQLNEALIFFAQKILYVTNNDLMFGDAPEAGQKADSITAVLQSLGNTILVHANDLQRQNTRHTLQESGLRSENDAVQRAFQPEPSATLASIIVRLQRYTKSGDNLDSGDALSAATSEQKAKIAGLQAEEATYLAGLPNLFAAYRSLQGKLPVPLRDEGATAVDLISAQRDQIAIAALYSAVTVPASDTQSGTLAPLRGWLKEQLKPGVVTSPSRPSRLSGLQKYLEDEDARLLSAGVVNIGNPHATLIALRAYLVADVGLAVVRANELSAAIAAINKVVDGQYRAAEAVTKKLVEAKIREKTVAVVEAVRPAVLVYAEQLNTRDPQILVNLLLRRFDELAATANQTKPSLADIALARSIIARFKMPATPCTTLSEWQGCKAKSTLEVVDNLIASLRAQRVQAVAAGDLISAENLLKATNAAYDQRTAMIYLRPASDYLRSVYSSNLLQDSTEQQYRNMLTDWFKKYLNPFEDDKKGLGRAELEKLHWQNVNKVTVTGGGATNYVLAKDDVGNWYVKAYGSDPEAIIKSATSLALFNSGKSINQNLLRRYDVQRQLDDENKTLTPERRIELQKELAASNPQGGQSLLKVRDRYASRYLRDTNAQASALLATVTELPRTVAAEIAKVKDWDEEACPANKSGELLTPSNSKYLEPARLKLASLVADQADPAKAGPKLLDETEKAIQATLTGMHLYSGDAQRVLAQAKTAGCETLQRVAGDQVRSYVRAQVVAAATERKLNVERYEEALSSILEIAGQN